MEGLIYLPQAKWESGTGRQVILKSDHRKVEYAILELPGACRAPEVVWDDATAAQVLATADSPANVMMLGFPNILHPGGFVHGGLSDNALRQNTADATMDFDNAGDKWGNEKTNQWYCLYAIADGVNFDLKAMPICRVKSQSVQTISLGTNITPATGIGYGWDTDSLADYVLYFLSGASKGLIRTITANNNDNGTGGTITYSGDALSVAEGDWFVILPDVDHRWIQNLWNSNGGILGSFKGRGDVYWWTEAYNEARTLSNISGIDQENVPWVDPMAYKIYLSIYDTDICELIVYGPGQGDEAGWELNLYQQITGLPAVPGVQRGSLWTFVEFCKATFTQSGSPTVTVTACEYPAGFRG